MVSTGSLYLGEEKADPTPLPPTQQLQKHLCCPEEKPTITVEEAQHS